jgi:hemerythrin-like domain-containing protein
MRHGEQGDLIDVLTTDHREVQGMFIELERAIGGPAHRKELVDNVTAELVRHSVAEEQYLYPAVRKVLPHGDSIADQEIHEHGEAEQLLKDLEGLQPGDPGFDQKLVKLISEVRKHIDHEESVIFVELASRCTPEQLRDLGAKVTKAKKLAPTHPHPGAPDTPPANKVGGPVLGLVDRLRDAMSER